MVGEREGTYVWPLNVGVAEGSKVGLVLGRAVGDEEGTWVGDEVATSDRIMTS